MGGSCVAKSPSAGQLGLFYTFIWKANALENISTIVTFTGVTATNNSSFRFYELAVLQNEPSFLEN